MNTQDTIELIDVKKRIQATDVDISGSTFIDVNLSGVAFTDVNLSGATFTDVNLSGVSLVDCSTDGMTIQGIAIADLMDAYRAAKGKVL